MKIKYVLLTIAILMVGCKTESIKPPQPPGGASSPPPSGMPPPSGSQSPPSSESGEQSDESGESSNSESSSDESGESSGSVGEIPPMEMPGESGEVGSEAGAEGDTEGDSDDDGDSNSDCGDTGELPGGVGGMGQAGECLGGGAASNNEETSDSSDGGMTGTGGAASNNEETSDSSDGGMTGTGGAGSVGQFPVESSAERAARLGRELEESIGGFDEVLLEEQREITAVGRNTEGFDGGSVGGGGGVDLGQQSSGGTISVANTRMSKPESPISGMTDQEIRERTPDDIPTFVDDGIIAKQLREAALSENDPELRERLWEEYRKFKDL